MDRETKNVIFGQLKRLKIFLELTNKWAEDSAFLGLPLFLLTAGVIEISEGDDDVAGASACAKEIKNWSQEIILILYQIINKLKYPLGFQKYTLQTSYLV